MLYTVLYYDVSVSEDELQEYTVEANDAYDAECLFKGFIRDMTGITIYAIGLTEPPEEEPEEYDSHSCSAYADIDGYCIVCGAVVHGSAADYELHGYDPPGTC